MTPRGFQFERWIERGALMVAEYNARSYVWSKTKARKSAQCVATREAIAPGEPIYRPMTNGGDRMVRVSATAVE